MVNSHLDRQMPVQVSYNLPMDMQVNVPMVDAPECESLGFKNNIDAYRQFVGPANLAEKRVISNEMGAEMLGAYRYEIPKLLWSVNRAAAGAINQFILHGQSYTGDYYGTTWRNYNDY